MFIEPFGVPLGFDAGGGSPDDEVDHLAVIAHCAAQIARWQGRQMAAMAAHVAHVERLTLDERGLPLVQEATQSAFAEINLVLNESGAYADNSIATACELAAKLPRTLAKVCSGELSQYRAIVMLNHTRGLSGAELAAAEEQGLEIAPALTPAKLNEKMRRIVARINPDAVVARHKAERKKRGVYVYPESDGMARLVAYMSAEKAWSIFGVVNAAAHEVKVRGDHRTIDQRRADALYELVCDPAAGAYRVRWQAQILVPVGTVLGLNGEPGHLPGYGPIPADICRQLTADATWRRILTDPATNTTLDVSPKRYRPSARQREFIHARDKTCRWPGCNRTRVEVDHTIRHEDGGLTVVRNLGDFCTHHHQMKDAPGWKVVQDDGIFTVITPSGRVYRTRPPGADGDPKPVEEIKIPKPGTAPPEEDVPPF